MVPKGEPDSYIIDERQGGVKSGTFDTFQFYKTFKDPVHWFLRPWS